MNSSKEEYVVKRRQKAKRRQNIIVFVSVISFFGSTVMAAIPAIQQITQQDNTPETVSLQSTLKQHEEGFELVLQREPNNQAALDGLLQVRLELNDIPGAIEVLEKLVKLNPEREDYKAQLEDLKKKVGNSAK